MIRLYSFHACDACAVLFRSGRHMSDKRNPVLPRNEVVYVWAVKNKCIYVWE